MQVAALRPVSAMKERPEESIIFLIIEHKGRA